MTIFPHDYTEETGWVHADDTLYSRELFVSPLNMHCHRITIQLPSKLLQPLHASLSCLLTTDIFTDIEIWVSGLKHRDKFKHIVLRSKTMCNLILYAIPYNLWTPYHNFGALHRYNKEYCDWAHRCILDKYNGTWTRYKYYANKSRYITQLTPETIQYLEWCKQFHPITQDKKSSIPYFK